MTLSCPATLPSAHASQFITLKTSPPTVNLYLPLSLHNFHNLSRCLNFSYCNHLVQRRSLLRTQANSSSPSKHLQQHQSYTPDRHWKQDTRNKRGSAGSTEILLNSKLTFSCFLLPFLHFPLILCLHILIDLYIIILILVFLLFKVPAIEEEFHWKKALAEALL